MSKSRTLESNFKGSAALISQSFFYDNEVKPFEPFHSSLDALTRFAGIFTGMGYTAGYSFYFAFKCVGAILHINELDSDRGTVPAIFAGGVSLGYLLLTLGAIPLNTIDFAGSTFNTIRNSSARSTLQENAENLAESSDVSSQEIRVRP
ncbi:hypothetical protein OQJ05_03330 [Fluoribacter gormanii]|uniref:hypothetical protein n=1 Tax=Fluoribacter gormanii TaxID=464 RepID=UPI002244F110|nr:hypothetical protein [Fluoribacter gormanii]MCW8443084.1 hypothetical protein [Fluoribacter gormanii]